VLEGSPETQYRRFRRDLVLVVIRGQQEPEQPVPLKMDTQPAAERPAASREIRREVARDRDAVDSQAVRWRDHERVDGPVDVEQAHGARREVVSAQTREPARQDPPRPLLMVGVAERPDRHFAAGRGLGGCRGERCDGQGESDAFHDPRAYAREDLGGQAMADDMTDAETAIQAIQGVENHPYGVILTRAVRLLRAARTKFAATDNAICRDRG
jgi:hypothetical protein